ncbi:MAG: hypothetical protein K1Y36_13280 [Blastocatellia bacterium]|nr:hypothetical protein [Blastocatellia bacterium]
MDITFLQPDSSPATRPLPHQRMAVTGYVFWLVSCLVFFVMGLAIGRISGPTPSETKPSAATVRTETAANGRTNEERLAATAAANAKYAVLVTVVSTAGEANQIVAELRRKGFTSAYITLPDAGSPTQLYSIKVGFYNLPTANQVTEELQRDLGYKNARVINN